jgi:hypothetical protein
MRSSPHCDAREQNDHRAWQTIGTSKGAVVIRKSESMRILPCNDSECRDEDGFVTSKPWRPLTAPH